MGNYCKIIPTVKNKDGQEVDSILFTELLDFHNKDREAAKRDYYIAISQEFLDSIKDDVTFDENGELTLHSLIKTAQLDPTGETIIKKLNKDIGSGIYDYAEGLQKAREFNRSEYGSDYLATLTKEGDKYRLSVVLNTSENQIAFEDVLKEQETQTMIIDELNKVGIKVDFMDKNSSYHGRFSTVSPTKAADGMYHLITLSRGETMESALKEEAAHFAIAAMHNTTQVSRLIEMCRDEAIINAMQVFTEEEIEAGMHENVYEAAGRILARHFNGGNTYKYGGFLNRIQNFIFNIVNKIRPESILARKMEIKILSKQIANEFMSGKSDLQTALDNPMTLYSADPKADITKSIVTAKIAIKNLMNTLYNANAILYKIVMGNEKIEKILKTDVTPTEFDLDFNLAGDLLQEAATVLIEEMDNAYTALQEMYASPDYDNDSYNEDVYSAVASLAGLADSLAQIESAIITIAEGNTTLKSFYSNVASLGFVDTVGNHRKSISGFHAIIDAAKAAVLDECRKIGGELLTEIAGRDSIILKGKFSFNLVKSKDKEGRKKRIGLYLGDEEIDTRDLIHYIYYSDGFLGRLFRVPTRLKDTAVSYFRKWTKDVNRSINRRVETEFLPRISTLETLAKGLGLSSDFSEFIEKDSKGKSRGNFISEYNMWVYEDLRSEKIRNIVDECRKYIKDNPSEFPTKRSERVYINKQIEENEDLATFEQESWIVDEETRLKTLNPEYEDGIYINTEYQDMKEQAERGDEEASKKLKLLEALLEYKNAVDALLIDSGGKSLAKPNRIPQISTKKYLFGFTLPKALNGGLIDTDSEFEIGAEGSSMYASALAEADESFAKLPIYGVRRIENPSADVLTTLKLYTVMAARYSELQNSLHRVMMTKRALSGRESKYKSNEDLQNVKAYEGILDRHLNRLYFGEDNPFMSHSKALTQKTTRKLWDTAQSYFVFKTIWMNFKSMASNWLQSNTNYLRNSIVSKHYSFWGYFRRIPRTTLYRMEWLGKGRKRDKMILYHLSGTYNKRVLWEDLNNKPLFKKWLIDNPMSVYSLGDAVGQEAVYLAMLDHYNGSEVGTTISRLEKEYGEDIDYMLENFDYSTIESISTKSGKTKSLRNMYKFSKTDEHGNKKDGVYLSNSFLKKKEDTAKYLYLKFFKDKLERTIEENNDPDRLGSGEYLSLVDLLPRNKFTDSLYEVFNLLDISVNNDDGSFITLNEALEEVNSAIDSLLWKESDLYSLSDSLLSENTEVQGTYFSDVKAAIQEDYMLKSMALYTGYAIGNFNRNWFSGYDVLKEEYVPSKFSTIAYSWLNLFLPNYDSQNFERRRKSVALWFSIAALNLPGVQNITRIPRVQEVLKKGGYSEQMIKRMYEFGNDILWWFFAYVIAGIFQRRRPDEASKQLGYTGGDFKKVRSKFSITDFDIDSHLYSLLDKVTGDVFKSHIIFDMMNKPIIDNDKIKSGVSRYLTKDNYLHQTIQDIEDYENDPAHALESFTTFLSEYSNRLMNGEDPKDALYNAADDTNTSREIAAALEVMLDNPDLAPAIKDGGSKDIMSYNEFCKKYELSSTDPLSRVIYASEKPDEGSDLPDYVKAYNRSALYNFTDADDMELLSRHLLSNVYKGMSYDDESLAYKICGIMYYFAKRNAEELEGMVSFDQNLEDVGTISFNFRDAMLILDEITSLPKLIGQIGDPNFKNNIMKASHDFFLKKVFFETDDYGYIFPPTQEELDDMRASEQDGREGAKLQDGFKEADRRSNFLNIKQ